MNFGAVGSEVVFDVDWMHLTDTYQAEQARLHGGSLICSKYVVVICLYCCGIFCGKCYFMCRGMCSCKRAMSHHHKVRHQLAIIQEPVQEQPINCLTASNQQPVGEVQNETPSLQF